MTRSAAGVIALLQGLGFGIPGVIGVRNFARQHEIWQFLGFPTYGDGPFERAGLPTTVCGWMATVAGPESTVTRAGRWEGSSPRERSSGPARLNGMATPGGSTPLGLVGGEACAAGPWATRVNPAHQRSNEEPR